MPRKPKASLTVAAKDTEEFVLVPRAFVESAQAAIEQLRAMRSLPSTSPLDADAPTEERDEHD